MHWFVVVWQWWWWQAATYFHSANKHNNVAYYQFARLPADHRYIAASPTQTMTSQTDVFFANCVSRHSWRRRRPQSSANIPVQGHHALLCLHVLTGNCITSNLVLNSCIPWCRARVASALLRSHETVCQHWRVPTIVIIDIIIKFIINSSRPSFVYEGPGANSQTGIWLLMILSNRKSNVVGNSS